uniref:Glycolipid transfer protein domain-containing protein n=1 Tax=Pseudictyota dubia TaxID=2749911 RepID=A0A7R9W955_9STRA|mmetsp:Transcript_40135/g.74190  ORF Transcript_40135/g.74190 Transcript_40135/m.74190 type:complete len:804 (+) Transcript_40135:710-3121(+)
MSAKQQDACFLTPNDPALESSCRFSHVGTKSASSERLADLVSDSHLSSALPIEAEEGVPDMLTAPGIGGLGRAQFFNVAILALLGLATAADLARRGVVTASRVDWGVDSSSQFYYDDLSTEGIVPPSRFAPPYETKAARSKLGLGSAMIGSVTTALSPILPFAGGVDLRRGEAWGLDGDEAGSASGWIRGAVDAMWEYSNSSSTWGWGLWSSPSAESSADSVAKVPRGGAGGGRSKSDRKSKRSVPVHREPALSAADPFLPAKSIGELTLGDITVAFRYAVESGRDGFNRKDFVKRAGEDGKPLSEHATKALDAMDTATAKSRGKGIEPAKTSALPKKVEEEVGGTGPLSPKVGFGDVDALQFCAAMRLFAEWRVLRQVPEGYKGYAVGMGLGHKDVVQNVVKIESAVHDLLLIQDEEMEYSLDDASCKTSDESEEESGVCPGSDASQLRAGPLRSPTLRDLLQYEIDHRVQTQGKLPRLKEKSAAMGLLWVRRQLQYQTAIFSNMLKVGSLPGSIFPTAIDAVRSAYSEVYDKFHGWAVQKIFNYSFQAAPEAEVIYKHMNPARLVEVTAQARSGEIDHVGGIRYESTETTESETVTIVSSEGDEEKMSEDTTVTRTTSMEKSWDDETSSSKSEEKVHTHSNDGSHQEILVEENQFIDNSTSTESEAKATNNNDDDSNPWVKFGSHIASEWDKLANHVGGECDKLGKHIGGEWDKLAANVVRLFNKDDNHGMSSSRGTDVRGGSSSPVDGGLSGEALEEYVSSQMAQDAHNHIERYLRIVRPLLTDLAGLFDEMNMDDPTKV